MTLKIPPEGVPLYLDERGSARVGESRVTLTTIVDAFELDYSAEEIADQFPTVTVAEVKAVLAFSHERQEEVDEYLRVRRKQADEFRAKMEARVRPVGIRQRLLERRKSRKQA